MARIAVAHPLGLQLDTSVGPKLERLTYVHDGDPGALGALIKRCGSRLRFGAEGSGLFEVGSHAEAGSPRGETPREEVFSIAVVGVDDLLPEMRAAVAGQVPCILGHAAGQTAVLVRSSAIDRLNGTPSDLRGKVRFGVARLEWTLR